MSNLRELYPQKAAPTRSGLVATLNDPYLIDLIAVVLFCLFCLISLLLTALRWNESYVATHPDGIERPGQVVAGSLEDAELHKLDKTRR
jgi:hypothetical protein